MGLLTRSRPGRAGVLACGLVAGAAGAVAMDSVQFTRYRRGGGRSPVRDWEFTVDVDDWSRAPATAQIGRQIIEAVTRRPWPVERASVTNNVVHWGYCMAWGAVFGLAQSSRRGRLPRPWHGLPFGAAVWLSSYVVMPLAGLYRPIWEYDIPVLAKDLGDHLAYGTGVSVAYRLLAAGPGAGGSRPEPPAAGRARPCRRPASPGLAVLDCGRLPPKIWAAWHAARR